MPITLEDRVEKSVGAPVLQARLLYILQSILSYIAHTFAVEQAGRPTWRGNGGVACAVARARPT